MSCKCGGRWATEHLPDCSWWRKPVKIKGPLTPVWERFLPVLGSVVFAVFLIGFISFVIFLAIPLIQAAFSYAQNYWFRG